MATGTTAQQIIDVVTPAAGESVSEGTILEWHVKVGDFIKATDTIVEISTDKVDLELPSPASGTVTEILIEEGETVTVGQVIARLAVGEERASDGGAAPEAPAAPAEETPTASAAPEPQPSAPAAQPPPAPARPPGGPAAAASQGASATPVAARAAAVEGVDLAEVSGSGPAGRITKA